MPTDIYDQHKAAFAQVSAYVVLDGATGERVATVAFKFPRDGAGRLYCYLHVFGTRMTRGYANGYGYDKKSAAASVAARRIATKETDASPADADTLATVAAFQKALRDSGYTWDRELENAGFKVLQAV